MASSAPTHQIAFLTAPTMRCTCGWTYQIPARNRGLSHPLQDNILLDEYNDHKKRKPRPIKYVKYDPQVDEGNVK